MLLAWWAARQPGVPAVESPSGRRSFKELNERANQLARVLRRLGLRTGDGVALLCANRPEFAEVVSAWLDGPGRRAAMAAAQTGRGGEAAGA